MLVVLATTAIICLSFSISAGIFQIIIEILKKID